MVNISLLKQRIYDIDVLQSSVISSMNNIGFNHNNLAGCRVAVKPNLLTIAAPDSGVITHPLFFHAVIKYIKENRGIPVLVESPAFLPLVKVLKKTGYMDIINKEKIEISDPSVTTSLQYNGLGNYKSFIVSQEVIDADFIFNLPKLKTHSLTYFTGAVKNFFGLIYGLEKSKWHMRTNNHHDFMIFLLDLYSSILQLKNGYIINLMDAILGLEGEGPGRTGKPKWAEAVIAGYDALAVDAVAIHVAGLDLNKNMICLQGETRGLGTASIEKIVLTGSALSEFGNKFIPPKVKRKITHSFFTSKFSKQIFLERPVPSKKKCCLCYQCRKICPAGAISESKDQVIPFFNYSKCIRCFCCSEICPEAAIQIRRGII